MAHKLADEVLSSILKTVLAIEDDDFVSNLRCSPFAHRAFSTADVLLVCKRWMRIATPFLFHTVVLRSTAQAQALVKALKKNNVGPQRFGRFIRRLRVEGSYGASMKYVLEQAPNIDHLAVNMAINANDGAKPLFSVLATAVDPVQLVIVKFAQNANMQAVTARRALETCVMQWTRLVRIRESTCARARI
jgi:hypothetical protein